MDGLVYCLRVAVWVCLCCIVVFVCELTSFWVVLVSVIWLVAMGVLVGCSGFYLW